MTVTNYIWDEVSDNVLLETDGEGAVTAQYTQEPELYGSVASQDRDGDTSFYHFDGQGSTRQLTDESQAVTDEATYSAFGTDVAESGSTVNPWGYKGRFGYYANPVTENLRVRARQLAPSLASWLSSGPFEYDGTSRYEFARNDPVNLNGLATFQAGHQAGNAPVKPLSGKLVPPAAPKLVGGQGPGPLCVVTFPDNDGKPWEAMNIEADLLGGVVLKNASSQQEVLQFLKKHRCCNVYFMGHRGGLQNEGGISTYSPKLKVILPDDKFEKMLNLVFRQSKCKTCAINIYGCVNDLAKAYWVRRGIAIDTGCVVCGSTVSPGLSTRPGCGAGFGTLCPPGKDISVFGGPALVTPWSYSCTGGEFPWEPPSSAWGNPPNQVIGKRQRAFLWGPQTIG